MGWKKLKEKFNIEHMVQVTEKGVCIGSGYVHNLIVINPKTGAVSCNQTFDSMRNEYPSLMAASPQEVLAVLAEDDEFEASIPVFTYTGAQIIEKQCEKLGWPNVTHDGCVMYENTFSTDKAKVVRWAKRNVQAGIEIEERELTSLEEDVRQVKKRLSEARAIKKKLMADSPERVDH